MKGISYLWRDGSEGGISTSEATKEGFFVSLGAATAITGYPQITLPVAVLSFALDRENEGIELGMFLRRSFQFISGATGGCVLKAQSLFLKMLAPIISVATKDMISMIPKYIFGPDHIFAQRYAETGILGRIGVTAAGSALCATAAAPLGPIAAGLGAVAGGSAAGYLIGATNRNKVKKD